MGTLLNVITVLVGGLLGLLMGTRLPDRLRQTVVTGLGLFTLAYGLQMFFKTQNALVVLGSLLIGAVLGEWWKIEERLIDVGRWLELRFVRSQGIARGFLTASLVFCVGPMTILGAIQDGLTGDYSTLAVKAVLDGFAALALASSLGVGVLFSAVVILVYQGALTLLAVQVQAWVSPAMMNEMSATGGVVLLAIAIGSLLELRPIRAASFLPALIIAPILASWVF